MGEKYNLVSVKDAMKVRDVLAKGMDTGNPAYDTYFMVGYEDGERAYATEDGQHKVVMDCPARKNFVVASREDTDESRQIRDGLVKLLRKHAEVSIRKSRK